ncbi:DNA cytosine methyltransferase [Streptomyces sp. NPDC002490]|uniref:DNA cytosine methyltransferase n=1 Tax=Streptomyces sp. NPDC002490 TaxID=3154416 RepID=UPI00332838BF
MSAGTRSGLWHHVARAIETLQPCLVVIENVRGLLTSPADPTSGELEPCPWCLGDHAGQPGMRALGAVLGSLADCGFDARWRVLRACDVGAPHRCEPVFLTAWPHHAAVEDADQQHRHERREPAAGEAERGGHGPNLADEVEWLLPTPKASDGIKGSPNQRHGNGDLTLSSAAARLRQEPRVPERWTSCRCSPGRTAVGTVRASRRPMGDGDPSGTGADL